MAEEGYYACMRCMERTEPLAHHVCADKRPKEDGGTLVLLSDDYRLELIELLNDMIIHEMADGLERTPFPSIMHDGGSPRFEFMLTANKEYHARGGSNSRTIGGVAKAVIALLVVHREASMRVAMSKARAEFGAAS